MKKILNIMSAFTLVFAFTAVQAVAGGGAGTGGADQGAGTGGSAVVEGTGGSIGAAIKASDIIGFNVENMQGEQLGEISDLAIDPQSGRVAFALVQEEAGALDVGGNYIPVPISAFSFQEDTALLSMSKDQLASAPSFEDDNLAAMTDPTTASESYRYFGVQPYWEGGAMDQPGAAPMPPDMEAPPDTGGAGTGGVLDDEMDGGTGGPETTPPGTSPY